MKSKTLKFVECDACHAKPGMPILCNGCLMNRETIDTLKDINEGIKKSIINISNYPQDVFNLYGGKMPWHLMIA